MKNERKFERDYFQKKKKRKELQNEENEEQEQKKVKEQKESLFIHFSDVNKKHVFCSRTFQTILF